MSSPDGNTAVRERLVLALDVPGLDEAVELADRLRPWFGVVKVGLELFSAEGPLAVDTLLDAGFRVFLDLKLHDIPTTVRRAAHRIGSLGVSYATVHAAGGGQMLKAAVEGFEEGWATAVANGQPDPQAGSAGILAVTVLTSEPDADSALVARRASLAVLAGCLGVVCAASDLAVVAGRGPELVTAVPGIRLKGACLDDQARAATPAVAVRDGADLLVVGRTVTGAEAPERAARQLTDEVLAAIEGGAFGPAQA